MDEDLIGALVAACEPANPRRRQAMELVSALGTLTGPEAVQLYQVACEDPDPSPLEPLECLRLPFLLFGPRFVIDAITGLRGGTLQPPVRELVVEPFYDV